MRKKGSSLADYVDQFRLMEMQVGAVFLIYGKVVGLDCFGSRTLSGGSSRNSLRAMRWML